METPRDISDRMRRVKSSGTKPEVALRKALWSRGIRYRTAVRSLPGKPDIVLGSAKVAIFVDGDFWHGGQWQKRGLTSLEQQFEGNQNREYWVHKIRSNMQRDAGATDRLLADGWLVLRFWESDVEKDLGACVSAVESALKNRAKVHDDRILSKLTFAEFFAGIGLMRMGLEREGWTAIYANDIDSEKHRMYRHQFNHDADIYRVADIHELSAKEIPQVTLATASFPCNDLSLAGSRTGIHGKHSSAYWGFIRLLNDMGRNRPPIILIENVSGFLTSKKGADFTAALNSLNALGYTVDSFMLNAKHFLPQSRLRLFVVATSGPERTESTFGLEQPIVSLLRPPALADFIRRTPQINWHLRPLPVPETTETELSRILDDVPETSPIWWNKSRVDYLLSQMSPHHLCKAQVMMSGNSWSYGTVFRRVRDGKSRAELRTDGIAGCLRTPRGGSAKQILVKAGKGKCYVRLLTPRECAKLMGAGEFRIEVTDNQAYFGFGDAVCVDVIAWIAKYYLNPLVNEMLRGRQFVPSPAMGDSTR